MMTTTLIRGVQSEADPCTSITISISQALVFATPCIITVLNLPRV